MLALRSFFFYLGYGASTIIMSTIFLLLTPIVSDRTLYRIASSWCGFTITWLRFCCGVRYEISGLENLAQMPAVLVSNHQSSWETILYYRLVYPVAPILKKELLDIPFWGWCLRRLHPIAIDRSKPREAGRSLLTQGIAAIKSGSAVFVFPEGSRSSGSQLGRFNKGAAKLAISAQVPVVPIVQDAGKCWPPKRFIKSPGTIQVVIGSAVSTEGREASELTAELRQWMQDQLGFFESQ